MVVFKIVHLVLFYCSDGSDIKLREGQDQFLGNGFRIPSCASASPLSAPSKDPKQRHERCSLLLITTGPLCWRASLHMTRRIVATRCTQHRSPLKSHNRCYQWKPGLCCGYTQLLSGLLHGFCQNQQDYGDLDRGQNSGKFNKWRALSVCTV